MEQLYLNVLAGTRISYHLVLVVQYEPDLTCSLMRRQRKFVTYSNRALNDLAVDDNATILLFV
jgi:hypothetical protein